jgi:hypothetical protein
MPSCCWGGAGVSRPLLATTVAGRSSGQLLDVSMLHKSRLSDVSDETDRNLGAMTLPQHKARCDVCVIAVKRPVVQTLNPRPPEWDYSGLSTRMAVHPIFIGGTAQLVCPFADRAEPFCDAFRSVVVGPNEARSPTQGKVPEQPVASSPCAFGRKPCRQKAGRANRRSPAPANRAAGRRRHFRRKRRRRFFHRPTCHIRATPILLGTWPSSARLRLG